MRPSDYIKTFLPIFLVILIYAMAIFVFIIPYFHEQLLNQKKQTVKELTVSTVSVLSHFNNQYKKGIFDLETAKNNAIIEVRSLRYGRELKDYFWITDTFPKMIMHPYRTDLVGEDLSHYEDPEGAKLFVNATAQVKDDGEGFINYLWQWKDDSSIVVPKISYVKLYDAWGWVIGSGIYIDDVEKEIDVIEQKLLYYSLAAIALAILLALYISLRGYRINTEKEKVREAFVKSQKKYKEIVENANTIILKLDIDGNVTFFNEFAQKLFDFDAKEILGKSIVGTILPYVGTGNFSIEGVRSIIRNVDRFENVENWNITRKGEERFIAWNNKPIFKDDGELEGILSIGNDITKRKQLLDQLVESEGKFKLIFNSVTDGIIIFTIFGRIVEVNEVAVKRSGYPKDEFLKVPMQAFLTEHPVLNFENLVEELGGKDFVSIEVNYHSKGGQLINLEVVAKKISYDGQEAYIAVTRDITKRLEVQHRIYNAVLEAEENERSRVAKELHDGISPILSTIKLYSQSLNDCQNNELKNEILKKIEETIDESIQGISDISNNLSPHILQNFGLLPALENFIEKIMDSKPIKFELNSDFQSELGNILDVTIFRIITELINNTIKYAGAENINIDLKENETIYLKYVDDGVGFDYDATIKDKKGMGLFNISNRVKLLKGYVNPKNS